MLRYTKFISEIKYFTSYLINSIAYHQGKVAPTVFQKVFWGEECSPCHSSSQQESLSNQSNSLPRAWKNCLNFFRSLNPLKGNITMLRYTNKTTKIKKTIFVKNNFSG